MKRRLRNAVLSSVVAAASVALAPTPAAAQASDPTVSVDRTGTTDGETMLVTGAGWTSGATVVVELCGHGGIDGSVDCLVSGQRTAGVGPSGNFSVELTSGKPPRPCPCVVKATDTASHIAATASIAVAGLPTVPITDVDEPERVIEISEIAITGGRHWSELFGASGDRVLEITLVNTGAVPVASPELDVAWGSGSDPNGFVEPPDVERMEPGQTRVVSVDVRFDALTVGEQTAVATVQGVGTPITERRSMSAYPWALLAVALIALQCLALAIRNKFRRRHQRRQSGDPEPSAIEGSMLGLPAPRPVDEVDAEPDGVEERGGVLIDLTDESIHEAVREPSGARIDVDDAAADRDVLAELEKQTTAAREEALRLVASSRADLADALERLEDLRAVTAATRRSALAAAATVRADLDAAIGRLTAHAARADEAAAGARAIVEDAMQRLDDQETMLRADQGDNRMFISDRLDGLPTARSDADLGSTPALPPSEDTDPFDRKLAEVLSRAIASATTRTHSSAD